MMGEVAVLIPRDVVRQDVEAVAGLYRNLGAAMAEQMVGRILGELALTLASLLAMVQSQNLRDLPARLAHLRRLAEELGLTTLSLVAADARICLETADSTAFAAVWARLVRVAERSIATEPGVVDRSG